MSAPVRQGSAPPESSAKSGSRSSRSSSDHKKRKRYSSSSSSSSSSSYSSSSDSDSSSSSSHERSHKRRSSSSRKHKSRKSKKPPGAPTLKSEDFFRYASEFREWLLTVKGIHMSSLKTDEARAIFDDFLRAWNKGKLAARYYAGIEPTSIAASSRSDHRWTFTGLDKGHLDSIRAEVNRATSAGKSTTVSSGGGDDDEEYFAPYGAGSSSSVGPTPPPSSSSIASRSRTDYEREREQKDREYERLKKERKNFRRHERNVEEELAPKATGRDRIMEKRREENYTRRSHEASRREDATIDPFDESAVDAVSAHVRSQEAAQDRKRQERAASVADKVQAAQAKEDQVMEQLRALSRNAGYRV